MKAKVVRGKGFKGVLDYVLDTGDVKGKEPEIVGGNMRGLTPNKLAREFGKTRELRPEIKRPVWHCSLSLPSKEWLTAEKWKKIADDFMVKMGFKDNAFTVIRHKDTDHDHVHIVASRINQTGEIWYGRFEAKTAIKATHALEKEHGLTLTKELPKERPEVAPLTSNEIFQALRTGEEPPKQRLQRLLDAALKTPKTSVELAELLTLAGVEVRVNLAKTGKMNGYSFDLGGVHFKASDLGKAYGWAGLQKKGIDYDEARDRAQLERLNTANEDYRKRRQAEPKLERAELEQAGSRDQRFETGSPPAPQLHEVQLTGPGGSGLAAHGGDGGTLEPGQQLGRDSREDYHSPSEFVGASTNSLGGHRNSSPAKEALTGWEALEEGKKRLEGLKNAIPGVEGASLAMKMTLEALKREEAEKKKQLEKKRKEPEQELSF